jgi:hypothetical protein
MMDFSHHGSEVSILVCEHGSQRSPSLSTSMGHRDLHPCLRAWRKGQRSPSSSPIMGLRDLYPCLRAWVSRISILVYEHGSEISIRVYEHGSRGSPSLSTSMENDLYRPSVFFLIEKIDPLESIFLTRSLDPPSQIFLHTM